MINEKIVIFGDSYSTFEGCIPEGYAAYYRAEHSSVNSPEKTWWHMLMKETGSELILNNSYSGSTICNTGYSGDCSKTTSFICRLNELCEGGFFRDNHIDRVLIFGATNDSWTGNECGCVQYDSWSDEDLLLILPGISFFISRLAEVVGASKMHYIINTELRDEVTNGIIDICEHYGVKYTRLSDIDKDNGHPTYLGMTQIKEQLKANI